MTAAIAQSNIIDFPTPAPQGKSNEWYTPARYVEAAREVMGGIDLDPASCEMANRTVKAARYYSLVEDGLRQEWYGTVWINPPYGKTGNKSTIELWIKRLICEYRNGNVGAAILLTTCDSDNAWFQLLWDYPICFTDHNVHFFKLGEDGKINKDSRHTQMFGTIFVYLGPYEQRFIDTFSQFGTIARRVSQPRVPISTPSLWETATTRSTDR